MIFTRKHIVIAVLFAVVGIAIGIGIKHYETLQHRFTYEADKSVSSFPVVVMKPGAELDEATVMLELSLKATESLSLGYPDRVNMRLMITNQLVKPAYWDMPLALYFGEYSKVKHQRCILLMGHDFNKGRVDRMGRIELLQLLDAAGACRV